MMLIIGLFITIPVFIVINRLEDITMKKVVRIALNVFLIAVSSLFIIACFLINQPPFEFKIKNPTEYIMYSAAIFVFTPFLWIVTIYWFKKFLRKLTIKKNSIIKKQENLIYYRDTLNEVSPSIIMFTSAFDIDYKKCISATILKLKLMGFLEKTENSLIYTNKDDTGLLDSEKQVLSLVKTGYFDNTIYKQTVEKETLKGKYIRKNLKGIWRRVLVIILIAVFTFLLYRSSFVFDYYVLKNYYYLKHNNSGYFVLGNEAEIQELNSHNIDENERVNKIGTRMKEGKREYNVYLNTIRADKLQYRVVKKAWVLNILVPVTIVFCIVWTLLAIYLIINQLICINKNYRRTPKGIELLNKAYALKNYLKDYSYIEDKREEEIVLWE